MAGLVRDAAFGAVKDNSPIHHADRKHMKVQFWGAAQTVTGSMHMVHHNGKQILLDCGLYQGRRKIAFERNKQLPFDATKVDAVILSHAHIDHSGNLPSPVSYTHLTLPTNREV